MKVVILAGGMAIAWGAGLIYPPAGIITAGVLAVAAGVLGALSEPAQKESGEDGGGG